MAPAPIVDFKKLIQQLGGPRELHWKLAECGIQPPPFPSVVGWQYRNTIPPRWLMAVLAIAQREGILEPFSSYLQMEEGA